MIKVLVIDDHPAVGMGTKAMLEQEQDIQVTVAETGQHALDLLAVEPYDILLVDLIMPEMNGLEFSSKVMKYHPQAKIIIYTGMDIGAHVDALIEVGISGFVSKTSSLEELVLAIRCCLLDQVMLPVTLFQQLRRKEAYILNENKGHQEIVAEGVTFNEKELQILISVAKGFKNREIANSLFVSQRTVEHHLTQIFSKLKVSSRTEAVAKAQQLGLLPQEQLRFST